MSENISEERIEAAYQSALEYGPEPFNHEDRATDVSDEEMFDFLLEMSSSDLFEDRAYYTAGERGVDICLVDWMVEVAEENPDGDEDFIDAVLDGYEQEDN